MCQKPTTPGRRPRLPAHAGQGLGHGFPAAERDHRAAGVQQFEDPVGDAGQLSAVQPLIGDEQAVVASQVGGTRAGSQAAYEGPLSLETPKYVLQDPCQLPVRSDWELVAPHRVHVAIVVNSFRCRDNWVSA